MLLTCWHNLPLPTAPHPPRANDTDADYDNLTTSLVGSGTSHGTLSFGSDGNFTYKPNAGYVGSDSFQYQDYDGAEFSNVATVTINVTDQAPVASNDSYNILHDQSLRVTASGVLANDSDADGDKLTAALVSNPSDGTVQIASDGSFQYTPKAGWSGSDSFSYQANDGAESSNVATVTINVTDQAPVANSDSYSVLHDQTLWVAASGVLGNDSDADGDKLTAAIASQPSHGSVTLNSDGSFTYVPEAHWSGSDSFTYTASDGILSSSPASVTINVTDNAPVANGDYYSVLHDSTLSITAASGVLANDSDADGDKMTAVLASQASHGSVTLNGDGSFTYVPEAHYAGSDSFTYTASDGILSSTPATVILYVTDNAPVANSDSYSVLHDQTLTVDASGVLSNDSDADGDNLTATLLSNPSNGTLQFNSDGSFVYTPNAHWMGSDSFTYQASDGILSSSQATVSINVTDSVPTATDHSYTVPANTAMTVNKTYGLLQGASDPDDDPLTVSAWTQPSNGTLRGYTKSAVLRRILERKGVTSTGRQSGATSCESAILPT